MTDISVLEIDRLTVSLGSGRAARPILDEVTVRVDTGEVVGLVGESGSGKSVTCRAALGLLPRGARVNGSVRVAGTEVVGLRGSGLRALRSRQVAMIYQDPRACVNPVRRIGDFLTEGLRTGLGMSAAQAQERIIELLELVGIRDPRAAMRQFPHEFSGGMLQRMVIAAALAPEPALLLADEPTTALDVTTQAEVIAVLTALRASRGTGMLFVTHDLELASAICDRIYVMYAGRVVEHAPVRRLFTRPRHPYTAALLMSTPTLASTNARLVAIEGRPVGLAEAPPGCSFAGRCVHVRDGCRDTVPPLRPVLERVSTGDALEAATQSAACLFEGELGDLLAPRSVVVPDAVSGCVG